MKGPHGFPDDRCHPSQVFRCTDAAAPRPNDLVIFLPGKAVSAAELQAIRSAAVEVFHFRPEDESADGYVFAY